MFLDMLLLSRVECGMKRKLHYYFITSLLLVCMQYANLLKLLNSIVVHSSERLLNCTCLNVRSVTRFALQVTSNYSIIFSNCGIDLYTGNTLNDVISFLKMRIDLYTRSTYTRVYTVIGKKWSFFKHGSIWWCCWEYFKLKIKQTAAYNTFLSLCYIQSGSP